MNPHELTADLPRIRVQGWRRSVRGGLPTAGIWWPMKQAIARRCSNPSSAVNCSHHGAAGLPRSGRRAWSRRPGSASGPSSTACRPSAADEPAAMEPQVRGVRSLRATRARRSLIAALPGSHKFAGEDHARWQCAPRVSGRRRGRRCRSSCRLPPAGCKRRDWSQQALPLPSSHCLPVAGCRASGHGQAARGASHATRTVGSWQQQRRQQRQGSGHADQQHRGPSGA